MKENDFITKFKKAWENPKGKAAIKFGFYLLGIIIITVIAAVGSRMSPKDNADVDAPKKLTYSEKIKELGNNNYSYIYEVTKGEEKIIFRGVKLDKRDLGYKETKEKTIRYYIDDQDYEILLGEKTPITNLYADTNSKLINMTFIIEEITTIEGELKEENYEKYYTYSDILDNIIINVYYNEDRITKIVTTDNESTAILVFSKLGEITEKDLSF